MTLALDTNQQSSISPRMDGELNAFKVSVEFLIFNAPLPYLLSLPFLSLDSQAINHPRVVAEPPRYYFFP